MELKKFSDKHRVNSTAIFCYTVLAIVLSASYLIEVIKKSRTVPYYIVFMLLLWVPYIIGRILIARNKETEQLKYVYAVGFAVFNIFVIFTTISPIAYIYAIMMAVILVCYNNNKLILFYMTGITLSNVAHVGYLLATGQIASADMPNVEIRVASLIMFTFCMCMGSKAAELTNRNRMEEIETEKEKVASLMEQILNVSNRMSENVVSVSHKMSELRDSSNQTKNSMEEVVRGTNETVDSIQMQKENTEEIHQAIRQVSDSTAAISDNISDTRQEINASKSNIDDLIRHVKLSNESNKNVSIEIVKLNEDAEKMQSIIKLINDVTSQTSLLALNASIEAARAGEAGKGFAVVASEISNLAVKTKDATVSITDLIENVSAELSKIVKVIEEMLRNSDEQNVVADNTAHSFEEIAVKAEAVYQEADKLNRLVEGLSAANEEVIKQIETISAATEEVTAHSSETLDTTQKNTDITHEVEQIVETLSNLAKELTLAES